MNVTKEPPTDALHDYARLKLDLAAIVRSLLHTAERRKDDLSIADCRRILARLAEDRFNLAIVGQFSRGKSSLMNALLGSEKLPTGILPLTSVITTVTYGETEKVLLQREGWSFPQEIRLNELADYVTQGRNPGNEKRVVLAEVQLPNELLRLGVHFVDTPGVASAIAANTRTTRQFLPEADAAILVTSFESPMTEAEVNFLQEVREHVRKVFIVVNKLDLALEPDRDAVIAAVRETVHLKFVDIQPELFAVSARLAIHAKETSSTEELARSGFPALEAALSEFLRTGKAREFLLRAAERTAQIAHQQELAIRISQRAGNLDKAGGLDERLQELSARLTEDREEMISAMRRQLPTLFRERCVAAAPLWHSQAEAFLGSQLEAWFSREQGEISGKAFEAYLQKSFQRLFSDWLTQHRDRIEVVFQDLVRKESGAIEALAAKIVALPASVLEEEEESSPRSFDACPLAFREVRVLPAGFDVPWWYELIPSGRWRDYLARRWRRRTPELGAIYERAGYELLETAMLDWIDGVSRELDTRVERTSAQVSKLLSQKPQLADLSELEELIDRVQTFMKTVLRMGNESSASYSSWISSEDLGDQDPLSIHPCPICVRLERALRDFMAQRQYELSVSENEQRNHALRSGFCPLHTWQYEAIASPQGVCAGYSELLALYGKKIRLLAQDATSVQGMEQGVRAMLPSATSCAACQLVTSTEKAAAREIARQLGDSKSSDSIVCTFHLRSVLMAGPALKTAAGLLLGEARSFERLAENMQNHILKHEAVRHHLATSGERYAAESGLAQLVGRRNTVTPWRSE
jgi:GTP-binding protein EngB required for normal cell division